MDKIKEKISNTKILAVIGVACMILGTFFAYFSIWGISISLLRYWEGYIILVAAVANLLIIFKTSVNKYMPAIFKGKFGNFLLDIKNPKASLIPTAIVLILVIYMHFSIKSKYINYSFGFFLEVIGLISLGVFPFMYKEEISISENTNEE